MQWSEYVKIHLKGKAATHSAGGWINGYWPDETTGNIFYDDSDKKLGPDHHPNKIYGRIPNNLKVISTKRYNGNDRYLCTEVHIVPQEMADEIRISEANIVKERQKITDRLNSATNLPGPIIEPSIKTNTPIRRRFFPIERSRP